MDIYQHNEAATAIGWVAVILLIVNATMLYFRRQIWLEGLCLVFLFLPFHYTDAQISAVFWTARHGIAYYLNILMLIVLGGCFLADYIVWASKIKKPRIYCFVGAIIFILGDIGTFLLVMSSMSNVEVFIVFCFLVPIGLFLLVSGIIGFIGRKMRNRKANADVYSDDEADLQTADAEEEPIDYTEAHDEERKKKILLCGAIGCGAIILGLVAWFVIKGSTDNTHDERFVFSERTFAHNTPAEDPDKSKILYFGDRVQILEYVDGGEMVKIKYTNQYGDSEEGYLRLSDLLDAGDFEILMQAGLKHSYVREKIDADTYRKAVLYYFKENPGDSIKIISPDIKGVCAETDYVNYRPTLAFIAGKKHTDDALVVYTIVEYGEPHLYSQNTMPEDAEGIKSISSKNGDIHVTLTPKESAKATNMTVEEEQFEDDDLGCYAGPEEDANCHEYVGTLNGKHAIEMTLNSDGGEYYTGEYCYTNFKNPIQLRGQLTGPDGHLVLEEHVGMNMTGKFEGTLSDSGYSGTWTSADGDKSMPFKLTVKR